MPPDTSTDHVFGEFRLDEGQRTLWRGDQEFVLPPKMFETLFALVRRPGRIVTKDELLKEVWADTFVTESTLARNISDLRKLLGDTPESARYIETIPKRGYRFVAAVQRPSSEPVAIAAPGVRRHPSLVKGAIAAAAILAAAAVLWALASPRRVAADPGDIRMRRITTSGTVLSSAISPDGRTFVFNTRDAAGSDTLWIGDTATAAVRELRGPADLSYRSLALSADGNTLYYVAATSVVPEGHLYRTPVGGGRVDEIARDVGEVIAFSPDGTQIAFVRRDAATGRTALIAAHADGHGQREILARPAERPLSRVSYAWSPDGASIAVAAARDDDGAQELVAVRVSDSATAPIGSTSWKAITGLAWSRDASGIVMSATRHDDHLEASQVWFVAYPGGTPRRLTNDLSAYIVTGSARGAWLALQHQTMSNIWIAPANDLSSAKRLTFSSFGRRDGASGLEWTPRGELLFTAFSANRQSVWRIGADGGGEREITSGPADTRVSMTADGTYLVFQSNRSGSQEVWRADGDGTNAKALTTGGNNTQPVVSGDGKWVVYRSAAGTLMRVSIDGGAPRQLTAEGASWPAISPDGRRVAFGLTDRPSGALRLAIAGIDGGAPLATFAVPRLANFRYGIRWTPDGTAVAYRDWTNGLWVQSIAGGEPSRMRGLPEERIYTYGWSRDGRQFAFVRGSQVRDLVLLTHE